LRQRLGLTQPIHIQYIKYVRSVVRGDFGTSWVTSQKVLADLAQRLPATMELILLAVLLSVLIGIPLGVYTAVRSKGTFDKGVFMYGMLAGALPDFWFALIIIFIFFFKLGWLPGPIGQLDLTVTVPPHVTGMYAVDALLAGDLSAFTSAVRHLALPVATLVAIYMPLVMKNARSTMEEMLNSDFVFYGRAAGLSRLHQIRYALRNSMPPVITIIGILFWFLLGGAVLVETVFAWGGLGQYAVQSVVNSDYAPLQAFVLLSAVFTMMIFLMVDLAYCLLDPRIKV
jgi:peptide/nickel transport system permease protein